MKPYTVKLLDRRYTGSHYFKYRIALNGPTEPGDFYSKLELWKDIRDWCDDTWGHSCEVNIHAIMMNRGRPTNAKWAWLHRGPSMRQRGNEYFFFLKDDKDLTLFELRW